MILMKKVREEEMAAAPLVLVGEELPVLVPVEVLLRLGVQPREEEEYKDRLWTCALVPREEDFKKLKIGSVKREIKVLRFSLKPVFPCRRNFILASNHVI
jgi:hypothetical protein